MTWLAVIAAASVAQAPPSPTPIPPVPAPPPPVASAPPPEAGFGAAQVRAGFLAAEAARGPLEGCWRLSLIDGAPLYVFQISDSGGAPDPRATSPQAPQLEGAWRDLRRPVALDSSGILVTVKRDGGGLSILFYEGVTPEAETISLVAAPGGEWTGELVAPGGREKVVMTRN